MHARLGRVVARLGVGVLAGTIGCLTATALAMAAAPLAVTGAVTAFGPTSATVSGTVNPGGQATTWYFEYGRTTSYGSRTASANAGSGTANVNVSTTIADLAPGTTYHYRFVATNTAGTAQGADGVLATAAAVAPDVVTGSAGSVTTTSATLSGSVNPKGRAATWYFEYGTSTSYGTRTPSQSAGAGASATGVSAPVGGLTAGRVYHFRLVATSDAGTTRGGDQTFSTGAAPAATTTSAASVSSTSARLNGRVGPNGQDTSWRFEYGTSAAYGSSTPTQSAGSGTGTRNVSASLSGLTAGVTYHFRLVATNASGTTAGADQTFVTVAAPAAETGAAQTVGPTSAMLTGAVDPRGRATNWYFEYGTSTRYGSRSSPTRTDPSPGRRVVTAAVSGLTAGTTYHFRLVATSSAGTTRGVDVAFSTAAASVSLARPAPLVVFGRQIMLSGGGQGGATITILAQSFGDGDFRPIATVRTDGGGRWSYSARPSIRTSYRASAGGAASQPVTVGVRPAVSLIRIRGARLSTHVGAVKSFAGRLVQLQRLTQGRWVTIRRARLDGNSSAIFRARALPRGTSTIRVAMSVNQAGPGYLAGFSRAIAYRRN
jgi:hypothetical protein